MTSSPTSRRTTLSDRNRTCAHITIANEAFLGCTILRDTVRAYIATALSSMQNVKESYHQSHVLRSGARSAPQLEISTSRHARRQKLNEGLLGAPHEISFCPVCLSLPDQPRTYSLLLDLRGSTRPPHTTSFSFFFDSLLLDKSETQRRRPGGSDFRVPRFIWRRGARRQRI